MKQLAILVGALVACSIFQVISDSHFGVVWPNGFLASIAAKLVWMTSGVVLFFAARGAGRSGGSRG